MPGTEEKVIPALTITEELRSSPKTLVKMLFMIAGLISLVLSVTLWFAGYREEGLFVGLWVPAVHSLGALVLAPPR